jgi:glycosyltransferase involved in cell wall biosynthesis
LWLQYVNLPDLLFLPVAKLLRMRVLVTPHLGLNWRSQKNPALRLTSRLLLRLAHRLALISRTQENELALPTGVPRSYIRNFLPRSVVEAAPRPNSQLEDAGQELRLVHSGRLSAAKGTIRFLEVCARLRDAKVDFTARVTGLADDETGIAIATFIEQYKLGGQVTVLGRIPHADLEEVLRSSDVLVHLSTIDSYPLIVLEALACETLPICVDLAGARDMIEQYDGLTVSTATAVADTVDALRSWDRTSLRQRAMVAGAAVRQDYSWDASAGVLRLALHACAAG